MNLSYKRLERRPAPAATQEAVRKTLEGALVQQKLEEKEIELIFMDEFSINTKEISSLVGERDILKLIIKTSRCHLYEHFLADERMEYLDEADPLLLMKSNTTLNVLQAIETSRKRLMTETSFLYTTMPRSTLAKQ